MLRKRPAAARAPYGPAKPHAAPRFAANIEVLTVSKTEANKPLQDFLAARFGLTRRTAKAVIDGRSVWVNRRCVWIAHHPLKTGDTVEVPRAVVSAAKRQCRAPADKAPAASAAAAKAPGRDIRHVRVIAETRDYVVADKPAGILSNADPKSVETILRLQLAIPTLQAVHRLDRDTTGCLLFAKNYAAYLAAVEVFKTRRVRKEYRALVVGAFPWAHQRVNTPLDGEAALSDIAREAVGADASLLKVRLETGRTNQIRRHLASIRFPIVGDRTFGLKNARDARLMTVSRQMLHAMQLELPNPTEKSETLRAHSPLPADFRQALKLFGMGRR